VKDLALKNEQIENAVGAASGENIPNDTLNTTGSEMSVAGTGMSTVEGNHLAKDGEGDLSNM
uniref:CSON013572 protein n=1 Tax=Culicoides sonorensis TaxID=179676 RepID=A0A336LH36_CULSO